MNDTDYASETIDCWASGQSIQFAGQHRNDPSQYVTRLKTDGKTIWSYGQPIVTTLDSVILLNLTPYIITADERGSYGPRSKFYSLSKATLKHQAQLTTFLYCRPAYKDITYVFDWDGTSRPNVIQLRAAYINAVERGYELTTLEAYIEDDCYTEAMRAAKSRIGSRASKNASYSPLNAFATLEVRPGVWRKVNVATGEIVPTVQEIIDGTGVVL